MARKDGTYDYKVTLTQARELKMKQEVSETVSEMMFMLYGQKSIASAREHFITNVLPAKRRWVKGKKKDILKQMKVTRVGH